MFADHFVPNLVIFLLGAAAAAGWLRTGMVVRGAVLLALLLVAADLALVARFVYDDRGAVFLLGLVLMQALAIAGLAWWTVYGVRLRWSPDRRNRSELLATGTRHYMRNELPEAEAIYRRLRRANPWDVAAVLGLATAVWRIGRIPVAARLLREARSLDRKGAYGQLIEEYTRRLG